MNHENIRVLPEDALVPRESFHDIVTSSIKVSSRNTALKKRLSRLESPRGKLSTLRDSEELKERYSALRNSQYARPSTNNEGKLEPGTCFLWFLIRPSAIREVLPDYEVLKCKSIFLSVLHNTGHCYEADFGLGKLYAHELDFEAALEHLTQASKLRPSDLLFKVWFTVLRLKRGDVSQTIGKEIRDEFEAILRMNPQQIEALWGLMELSLLGVLPEGQQIDSPKFYASRIKEIDSYMGYLAWSEVYTRGQLNVDLGVSALKELVQMSPQRPEAYFKLWSYHYYELKDYRKAEDVATEAFVRLADSGISESHILFSLFYAKTCIRNEAKRQNSIEMLQRKFKDHPEYPVLLFFSGKYCVKYRMSEYLSSAISVLNECMRMCSPTRHARVLYWLSEAYYLNNQKWESYTAAHRALEYVNSPQLRAKVLKRVTELERLQVLATSVDLAVTSPYWEEINSIDSHLAECLAAKAEWESHGTLERLVEISKKAPCSGTAHLLHVLKQVRSPEIGLKYAKELLEQAKCPQVPLHIWIQSVLLYSKLLSKQNQTEKAIHLLKCLAFYFYPYSYDEAPYSKLLHQSSNIHELQVAAATCEHDFYTSFESPWPSKDPVYEGDTFMLSPLLEPFKPYSENRVLCLDEDEDIKCLMGRTQQFSVSGDYSFLYSIAQLSERSGLFTEDGLCAITDYTTFLHYDMNPIDLPQRQLKAEFIKAALLARSQYSSAGRNKLTELLPLLTQRGLSHQLTRAGEILSEVPFS